MAGPGICHWYLTMTRHPETNGKADIWLWKISHIFPKMNARSSLSACWTMEFLHLSQWDASIFFGIMPAEQSSHWLDPVATEREKMACTMQIELGRDWVCCFFNVFSMFNLCSAFYLKVACCLHFVFSMAARIYVSSTYRVRVGYLTLFLAYCVYSTFFVSPLRFPQISLISTAIGTQAYI